MGQDTIYKLIPQDCKEYLQNITDDSIVTIPFFRNDNSDVVYEAVSEISHMLVAGTTGTGKTMYIQTLLTFLSVGYNLQRIRFIIIASKGMEYTPFNGVPHLLIPIVTDMEKALAVFSWLEKEIENRLSKQRWETDLFIVVDDYATLSMNGYYNESQLMRILQLGRSVGVHFWLVTSIPTAKIISTELKLNIPYRIAFRVTSKSVSRMILDDMGAEGLYVPGGVQYKSLNKMVTGKVIYMEEEIIVAILNSIKGSVSVPQNNFDSILSKPTKLSSVINDMDYAGEIDPYFEEAARILIDKEKASIGMLQRYLKIGFSRAMRIMDQLEEHGVVGPEEGTKPRKILLNAAQFEQLISKLDRDKSQKEVQDMSVGIVKETDQNVQGSVFDGNSGSTTRIKSNEMVNNSNDGCSKNVAAQVIQKKEQNGLISEQTGLEILKEEAIRAFSQNVVEENSEKEISFTPRVLIQGKDAGLEICDDHIEISKRLNAVQTATYSFVPRRIKRVVFHAPSLLSDGYVRFELDSFEWNIIDERTKNERPQKLPEQVFTVKFDRGMKLVFEGYARQITTEAHIEYIVE